MRSDESPFDQRLGTDEARGVRFVRPELVGEIEFRTWTGDGLLRHAAFRGLRADKPASEVVRETSVGAVTEPELPKRTVVLTHPDRIYWPDEGVTKEGLADYYTDVWKYMAPFIVQRPLALLRCPDGIGGQHFFQKHAWKGLNKNIVLIHDPKDKDDIPLVSIDDLDGLLGLVQAGSLELHPWGITTADWEHPDMIVMDLDPGPRVPWDKVIEAAEETRDRMKQAGLEAFVKTSGGKGLHVVSPLKATAEWPDVKAFTKSVADQMAADSPERYVSTITKSKRAGKILIDYLRNQRGSTAVAPYSTRARPGAAVSMPLTWEELNPAIGPAYFTVNNAPTRLAALRSDPWEDFRAAAAPIEQAKSKKGRAR
jgi:bifunctional non-homologous end joining protein LigD